MAQNATSEPSPEAELLESVTRVCIPDAIAATQGRCAWTFEPARDASVRSGRYCCRTTGPLCGHLDYETRAPRWPTAAAPRLGQDQRSAADTRPWCLYCELESASNSRNRADDAMPIWKFRRLNFSFGACSESSGSP